jgi:GTP-binding protein
LAKTKIAVTSKTPGRTHTVNFYDFDRFRLVDLPGYGYADYSNEKKDEMRYTIDTYLSKRINLYGVFHVIDAGVITKLDQEMSVYFKSKFVNHFIIVNKIDKLNQSEKSNLVKKVSSYTKVPNEKIIVISAKKSIGINQI